jgi:hypothetical protein
MHTCNGAEDLSGGLLEINDDGMELRTHRPTGRCRPGEVSYAHLILYRQPLTARAR